MKVSTVFAPAFAVIFAAGAAHAANPMPVAQYRLDGTLASSVANAAALTVMDPLGQSDNGFCVDPSNNLDIFPVAGGAAFTNDTYHDVFLVNNRGVVTFYLDGSVQATAATSVMNLDPSQTMNFFLDNVVAGGQGEYSSGSMALIRVHNEALNAVPPPAAGLTA